MQNQRTLKFWDDYHIANQGHEWIVHPTGELFQLIESHLPKSSGDPSETIRLMEIGCGTSALAREVWKNFQEGGCPSESEAHASLSVHVCATDVSEVCIDACYQRDCDIPGVAMGTTIDGYDDLPQQPKSLLEYRVLNMLESPRAEDVGKWLVVLDKACLDTFLFRSRQRGEHKVYPQVLQTALDNVWSMLSDNGVYMLISPRTKLKAVRDYNGFAEVKRSSFDSTKKGSVESKKNVPGGKVEGKSDEKDHICHIYVCHKNLDYVPGVSRPFKASYRELPLDDAACNCGLKFVDFRKGEDVEGRGTVFWTRQWKNHCIHCKSPHVKKWNQ